MKIQRTILLFVTMLFVWCGTDMVFAEGINQQMPGLDAKSGAKVARFKAEVQSLGTGGPGTGAAKSANCGSVSIGNVRTGPGGAAPREVTTIVTGDVINVSNGNCR
ncbi:hypothetical protein CCP3SC15_90034 [Gammaproteobacteria bacterium]